MKEKERRLRVTPLSPKSLHGGRLAGEKLPSAQHGFKPDFENPNSLVGRSPGPGLGPVRTRVIDPCRAGSALLPRLGQIPALELISCGLEAGQLQMMAAPTIRKDHSQEKGVLSRQSPWTHTGASLTSTLFICKMGTVIMPSP